MASTADERAAIPQTLPALVGNLWCPAWAIRPGAYRALAPLAGTMPLWLLLHSRNGDYWKPCYATRDQLGETLGISRASVTRYLAKLRKAHLLFEVDRERDPKTERPRVPARWALDPFAADIWREKVEQALTQVAEDDGHDGRWYRKHITRLDAFDRRCRFVGAKIAEDMPFAPRKRRRRKGSRGAATQIEPTTQIEP